MSSPALLPRFARERGPAQQCYHLYANTFRVCGHSLKRADGSIDTRGRHAALCGTGGGFDRRHTRLKEWVRTWLRDVCHLPTVYKAEQYVAQWCRPVQAKGANGAPLVDAASGAPVMTWEEAWLDVGYVDDLGVPGYVDVTYVNASPWDDSPELLERASTAGKAASDATRRKLLRYPPASYPEAELVPFAVEARGRLGSEVLPFLRQHAPQGPARGAVLARAKRDISIITHQGLAALLLTAEPRIHGA